MTDRSPSFSTQIAPVTASTVLRTSISLPASDTTLLVPETVEEEPYTIKCICAYQDDDGSTVYCEGCDTWQHIECYYPGRIEDASKEEFDHSCADCKPRPLDSRTATDRQRHHRQNKALGNADDKKTKRPPSKSHKKKVKATELQLNGEERHRNGSVHDAHTHVKKPKGHRASQSVSKRSPSLNPRPQNVRPLSPVSTPPDLPHNLQIHDYSDHFLALFNDEDTYQSTTTNSFASLAVSNAMTSWVREPARLLEETGQRNFDDVSQNITVPLESLSWPKLHIDRREDNHERTRLKWRSLVNTDDLRESGRIGELTGVVGFQKDYTNDLTNRWNEVPQPRPFIFFCPQLPLFIDTRKEGSICRYVRRSCRSNTQLELYIANEADYHFWLVSDRPLAANEQVTIPWQFNFPKDVASRYLHLLNLSDGDISTKDTGEITDAEYDALSAAIFTVLSDHGGCACGLGNDCSFARFHRNYHGKSQPVVVKSKKGRKPKQNHISPTSTGQATNSRAASEGQEVFDDDDARSQSDSARSKPHSRDMTPSHGVGESNGTFPEPSDREKRKLAALEDSFRKLEQQPARKKTKRTSDTVASNLPGGAVGQHKARKPSTAPRTTSVSQVPTANSSSSRARQYIDASTSRRQSGSPTSATSPVNGQSHSTNPDSSRGQSVPRPRLASTTPKSVYADSSTQTDPVQGAWWDSNNKPKKRVITLAARLMKNRHKVHAVQAEQARQAIEQASSRTSPAISTDLDKSTAGERQTESPTEVKVRQASTSSIPSIDASTDINMPDAPPIVVSNAIKPPPPPWPGQAAVETSTKGGDMRVQMPAPPMFSNSSTTSGSVSTSMTPSPSPAASATAQSPFGTVNFPPNIYAGANGVLPSPAKAPKKLSLSDYKARMKTSAANKTAASNVVSSVGENVKPVEVKGVLLEGTAVVESPAQEKAVDPMAKANGV